MNTTRPVTTQSSGKKYHQASEFLFHLIHLRRTLTFKIPILDGAFVRIKMQICPRCESPIFPFIGFSAGLIYECKKCGYHGPLALNEVKKSVRRRI